MIDSPLICLCDNDLILKIFACNLIPQTLDLLRVDDDKVRVLATANAWFKDNLQRKNEKWPPSLHEALERAEAWVRTKAEYPGHELDTLDVLALSRLGIDVGERAFFAVKSLEPLIFTGDRKCLNKIGDPAARQHNPRVNAIYTRWCGRVIWFDAVVLRLLRDDPTLVATHLWPGCACDGALKQALTQGAKTPFADVESYFDQRVQRLKSHTQLLLRDLN